MGGSKFCNYSYPNSSLFLYTCSILISMCFFISGFMFFLIIFFGVTIIEILSNNIINLLILPSYELSIHSYYAYNICALLYIHIRGSPTVTLIKNDNENNIGMLPILILPSCLGDFVCSLLLRFLI